MNSNCATYNTPTQTMMIMAEHYDMFYRFFQKQIMCDVTLVSDDGTQIEAHKLILAPASSMLLSMLYGSFKESKENKIFIKEIDSDILKSILTCAYTFKLNVKENNIENLLRAADYFDFNHARDLCFSYIKHNIDANNCIDFMRYTKSISQPGLYTFCFSYLLNNFKTIVKNESNLNSLYEFDCDDVVELIKKDHLLIESEDKVLDFIIGWINYNTNERNKYLPNLMKHLRSPLFSMNGRRRICNEPLLESNIDCLIDVLKRMVTNDKTNFRTPQRYEPNIMLAIKGLSNGNDSCVMYLDPRAQTNINWKPSNFLFFCPRRIETTLVVSDNGILLAIGGRNEFGHFTNCVDELDLSSTSKRWVPTSPLLQLRTMFSVSAKGKYIYVVGGCSFNNRILNTIEYYDTCSKIWIEIEEQMPSPRKLSNVIIHAEWVYVIGGFGENCKRLNSVDRYNTIENQWQQMESMPLRQGSMGIVIRENDCYLFGGFPVLTKRVLKFNLQSSIWQPLPEMNFGKRMSSGVLVGNNLYVVGKNKAWWIGKDSRSDGVFCERYVPEKNEWQVIIPLEELPDYDHIICLNDELLKTFNMPL
ncbi:kelch-like protein 3 [Adelges cooleyi]|uniref:kelch-like protein 3 n=1 Tax=Adelges cooleyi TaxID=133065 RepID=UPI0021800D30|nr:kelch-like protein 3 [Adelges cooleyi]